MNKNDCVIKHIGANGQVCLGKEYAGRKIQITKLENGTLLISFGQFMPDNERWLYQGNNFDKLNKSIAWSESQPRKFDNFDEILNRFEND